MFIRSGRIATYIPVYYHHHHESTPRPTCEEQFEVGTTSYQQCIKDREASQVVCNVVGACIGSILLIALIIEAVIMFKD